MIRYITSSCTFGYAEDGSYFIHNDICYVGTNDFILEKLNVKRELHDLGVKHNLDDYLFIIKVTFAGQDTGFRDDFGKVIFTGDVVILVGCYSKELDLYDGTNKSRNKYIKDSDKCSTVCGVVGSNPVHQRMYNHPLYEVVLDNHGAFLVTARTIEIIGNVFYDLPKDEPIDIWTLAGRFAFSGIKENGFWSNNTIETAKEAFLEIPTPTFLANNESITKMRLKRPFSWIKSTIQSFMRLICFQ